MANQAEYDNAAKKLSSHRTTEEQALVDKGVAAGMQSVKNADHAAKRHGRIHGS